MALEAKDTGQTPELRKLQGSQADLPPITTYPVSCQQLLAEETLCSEIAFKMGRRFQGCFSSGSVTHNQVDFLVILWSLSHHAPECNPHTSSCK